MTNKSLSSYRVSTISFEFGQKKSKYTVDPIYTGAELLIYNIENIYFKKEWDFLRFNQLPVNFSAQNGKHSQLDLSVFFARANTY